jgi:hypothetical protein
LGATCGACGNDLPAGSRFGNKCGTPDKIRDRDDLREIREKVTGKLLTLDEALKPTLPAVLALLDVPADDAVWQGWRRPSGASARLTP